MPIQTRIAIRRTKRQARKVIRDHEQKEKEIKKGNIKLITSMLQSPDIIIKDESYSRAKDDPWIKDKQKLYPELKEATIFVAYSPDEKEEICIMKRIDKTPVGPSTEDALFDVDLGKRSPHMMYFDRKTSKQLFELAYQRNSLEWKKRDTTSDVKRDRDIRAWLLNLGKALKVK